VVKQRNEKYILSLSMELVKIGGYDFPGPRDGPQNSPLGTNAIQLPKERTWKMSAVLNVGQPGQLSQCSE
jgi:hypothetical protein